MSSISQPMVFSFLCYNPFSTAVPFGDNLLGIKVVCPQKETAVCSKRVYTWPPLVTVVDLEAPRCRKLKWEYTPSRRSFLVLQKPLVPSERPGEKKKSLKKKALES